MSSMLKITFVVRSPKSLRKIDQREVWWNVRLLLYYLALYFCSKLEESNEIQFPVYKMFAL